jgi:hypothetical protein
MLIITNMYINTQLYMEAESLNLACRYDGNLPLGRGSEEPEYRISDFITGILEWYQTILERYVALDQAFDRQTLLRNCQSTYNQIGENFDGNFRVMDQLAFVGLMGKVLIETSYTMSELPVRTFIHQELSVLSSFFIKNTMANDEDALDRFLASQSKESMVSE